MNYPKIGETANRLVNTSGPFMFIISGAGVSINYYLPSLIPSKLISGMYWVVSMSVIYMVWSLIQHFKNPHHVVGEKCPKCQKPLLNTGVKCSNPDCGFKVKFN